MGGTLSQGFEPIGSIEESPSMYRSDSAPAAQFFPDQSPVGTIPAPIPKQTAVLPYVWLPTPTAQVSPSYCDGLYDS